MSVGLIALLDDVAAIAKAAAASVDDVVGQAAKAGVKSAGLVIDDAAVTPRYVVGLSPARELPIIAKIARGSLKNKLVFLLPIALALGALAPWAITPLLMLGGLYLSYEGAEKVFEALSPEAAHGHESRVAAAPRSPEALENAKVTSAVRTDFILSAEIMAIALSSVPDAGFFVQAGALALVGLAMTALVYGGVALIVKADDAGVALARREGADALDRAIRALGRGLVSGMPWFLQALAVVGTIAMLWVGGGILLHGLAVMGLAGPELALEGLAEALGHAVPAAEGAVGWVTHALGAGIVGLGAGALLIPVTEKVLSPAFRKAMALFGR